jgi:hypothetical protein
MSLFGKRAEVLADQSSPQEIITLLRSLDTLDDEQQQTLDWVLTDWTMMLISRPSDLEGVVKMHTLCELAQSFLPEPPAANTLRNRWGGFADVLEGKRLAIRARSSPQRTALLQEPAILTQLQEKSEIAQSELTETLKLSPGRVSQILAIMESRAQITRSKRGKENWVALMPHATLPATANAAMQERAPYVVTPTEKQTGQPVGPRTDSPGAIFLAYQQAA